MKKPIISLFKFPIKIINIKKKNIIYNFSYRHCFYFWKRKKQKKLKKNFSFYASYIFDKNLFLWENNIVRKIIKKRQMYNIKNLKKQNKHFEKFKSY